MSIHPAALVPIAGLCVALAAGAEEAPWALPAPGSCAEPAPAAEDASPRVGAPAEGDVIRFEGLSALEPYVPPEVWEWKDRFFHEGMRLEVGPCYRSYTPPGFFRAASAEHAGEAKLLAGGGMAGGKAGLPFDPGAIAADDPQAGQKWAWNAERRWRGAGRFGEVRVTHAGQGDAPRTLVGEHFVAWLIGRADLRKSGYRRSWAKKERWVAGGKIRDPSTNVRCAFRQYRGVEAEAKRDARDDVFFWSSQMRKAERVGWDTEFPLLACAYERGFYLPRGGAVQRYAWRAVGTRDLLVPINARTKLHPTVSDRDFGPWGASFASDRWELRRALVLEAAPPGWKIHRYLDLETLFPLYHVEDLDGAVTVIQYVGRWSEDRDGYPRLPDARDSPVRVIDPVAQAMVRAREVVRVEAWETVAVPEKPGRLQRLVSTGSLTKSR